MKRIFLILKHETEIDKKNPAKRQKNRLNVLNLLIGVEMNWKKCRKLLEMYNLEDHGK